jgi:hypothetical protein
MKHVENRNVELMWKTAPDVEFIFGGSHGRHGRRPDQWLLRRISARVACQFSSRSSQDPLDPHLATPSLRDWYPNHPVGRTKHWIFVQIWECHGMPKSKISKTPKLITGTSISPSPNAFKFFTLPLFVFLKVTDKSDSRFQTAGFSSPGSKES